MNEVQILTWLKTLKSPITTTQPPIPFSSSCISPNRELLYTKQSTKHTNI